MKLRLSRTIIVRCLFILLALITLTVSVLGTDSISAEPISSLLVYGPLSSESDVNRSTANLITPSGRLIDAKKYTGPNSVEYYNDPTNRYHPTQIGSPSPYYNCHSYAWYFGGSATGISNSTAFWLNSDGAVDFSGITSCYERVLDVDISSPLLINYEYRSQLEPGDIIVYLTGTGEISMGDYKHSAVIISISSTAIIVNSKWGACELFRHEYRDCPYIYTINTRQVPSEEADFVNVRVFRPLHLNDGRNNALPEYVNSTTYRLPDYVPYNDTYHKIACDCGRGYTSLELHDFVQMGATTYKCSDCDHIYTTSSVNSTGGEEQ